VPLLLFEQALRMFGPFLPGEYQLGLLMVAHPEYGQFHARSSLAWYRTSEYVAQVRTNSHGLRGDEIVEPRPPEAGRILVSGDSFVEARQVPEPRSMVALLDAALNEPLNRASTGRSRGQLCEVLNGGIAGWGTGEQYVYLRNEGLRLKPDLVVLVFYLGNDVSNNDRRAHPNRGWHVGPGFRLDAAGALEELPLRVEADESPLVSLLRRHLLAFTYVESGVLAKLKPDDADEEGRTGIGREDLFAAREPRDVRWAWELPGALIGAIKHEVEQAGSQMMLVAVPASYQVYPEDWRRLSRSTTGRDGQQNTSPRFDLEAPNRRLAALAARYELPFLDLLPSFRQAAVAGGQSGERLYFRQDPHWTEAGNRLAAAELTRFLHAAADRAPAGCRAPP